MEDTGRVDDEGRAVLERADLTEEFFENVHRGNYRVLSCSEANHVVNLLSQLAIGVSCTRV